MVLDKIVENTIAEHTKNPGHSCSQLIHQNALTFMYCKVPLMNSQENYFESKTLLLFIYLQSSIWAVTKLKEIILKWQPLDMEPFNFRQLQLPPGKVYNCIGNLIKFLPSKDVSKIFKIQIFF